MPRIKHVPGESAPGAPSGAPPVKVKLVEIRVEKDLLRWFVLRDGHEAGFVEKVDGPWPFLAYRGVGWGNQLLGVFDDRAAAVAAVVA